MKEIDSILYPNIITNTVKKNKKKKNIVEILPVK